MKKFKQNYKDHLGLLSLLGAICIVSVYGIFSFASMTQDYIDYGSASVFNFNSIENNPEAMLAVSPSSNLCDPFCLSLGSEGGEVYEIFSDVDSSHKNSIAIEKFYDLGVIEGYNDGSFGVDKSLNRAELLKVLTTTVDADFSGMILDNCFLDVADEWFAPFVCFAKNVGWVDGYEGNVFRPAQNVTRSEALKMVMETFEYDIPLEFQESELMDVNIEDWFAPYISVASNSGIIAFDGRYFPAQDITRAEFMQLVYNAMFYKGVL